MRSVLPALLFCWMTALAPVTARADDVLVFAAVSLKEALEDVAKAWNAESGHAVTLSFAGSSTLARQIQAGAPADVFLSANEAWMDVLESDGLLRHGSRRDLLANTLVLVSHDPAIGEPDTTDPKALSDLLGPERLAMALVDAVPAGTYGKAALQALGWWPDTAPKIAQADNVRAALARVATGEAPLGVVYATDALAEPRVHVVMRFPEGSHPQIRYPMAITAESQAPEASAFAAFLAGSQAEEIFHRHGFDPVPVGAE